MVSSDTNSQCYKEHCSNHTKADEHQSITTNSLPARRCWEHTPQPGGSRATTPQAPGTSWCWQEEEEPVSKRYETRY